MSNHWHKYPKNAHEKEGQERLENKKEQTLAKLYKKEDQKIIHTGPTNSAGTSFPNRSQFALVAVGKGLVAQYIKF